ncbi:lysophospholipase/glycerophospholipid:cholesterol acyltransferase PlaC [Legionella quateirensis]|uniref:Phospholipase/lecithinase/hemolysin n=1 Tax=Legionella quateirensis TaxID=45072 RepID=A0A378L0H1_9GAMM|nr:SGNH/GDSL hydrolase family protein [Legionella quateirensis]KTD49245.1 phospholipase/lecithinase/hemolysin [Legionella quateirensis]STY19341.1 phospholipase/lecithinase/hemolysin, lysophospholipase A, glycerophospholipid-cholesterol acyltransferase [Legionella quateirensis]
MYYHNRMCRWLCILLFFIPLVSAASIPVKSMVVFGDSLSDTGNTTHLLKSLRSEENPAYIVAPFKVFVINKMIEFANDYYVPQIVLDAGILAVTDFFDHDLAPYIVNLIAQVKLVPILPGKPYWKSRFSNGRVWNEYLADMFSIQKDDEEVYLNRAFGGSWAATYDTQLTVWNVIRHPLGIIKTLIVGKLIPPSLGLTVQAYLLEHQKLSNETVYFVFSGGNDYINALQYEDKYDPAVMSAYIDNIVDGVSSAVLKLTQAGARRIVVLGVPHAGDTPKFVKTADRELLNFASDQHNERLAIRVAEWKQLYPDADILFINTQEYLERAVNEPGNYGFANVTDACIDVKFPMFQGITHSAFANNFVLRYAQVLQYKDKSFAPGETNYHVCDVPDDYLFWDEIHPSTRAHHHFAYEVCSAMKDHGYDVRCKKPESAQA